MLERQQQNRTALGSQALLTIFTPLDRDPASVFSSAWDYIEAFEARFSRFKEASELSRFNARAGQQMTVSAPFRALLLTCKDLAEATAGLFNPFILPDLNRAGYIGSWPTPARFDPQLNYARRSMTAIESLQIGPDWATIPADTALDFGGIGKGYVLDEVADLLHAQGIDNFWISLGGDIVCAGFDLDNVPWSVGVQRADGSDELVATIQNDTGTRLGIATSGVTKRRGTDWHHIIDPRTGKAADTDVLTATVTAASGVQADVYAKCLVIVGSAETGHIPQQFRLGSVYLQLVDGSTKAYPFTKKVAS